VRSANIRYQPPIDHLRGGAALLATVYHSIHFLATTTDWWTVGDPLSSFLYEGHTAVALFFVISGFIFMYGTARGRVSQA
jgi:peptidoglycan/LPS O-acetylase OafA/YrhL